MAANHPGIITTAGQLLIGTGANGTVLGSPAIAAGTLTSPNATINVGYSGGNITIDTGAVAGVTFQTQSGSASAVGNILNIVGAAGVTTSGTSNTITIMGGGAGATLSLIPQTGTNPVVPTGGNQISISGAVVAAGTNPIRTDGGTNLLTIEVQKSQALVAADATKIGLSNFYSPQFSVDANGFVQLAGGVSPPILSINVDANTAPGTNPVVSSSGAITITGGQVASGVVGANVIRSDSLAANTFTIEIQRSAAVAATDSTKNGVSHFDSGKFTVDANGFVSLASTVFGTITGDTGGALPQTASNWNILGSGSITTSGAGSTLTVQLQNLTNHAVLVGAGTTTITKVGPTATSGQVLQSQGAAADPAFSTATYPSTTTINQILYSSSANTVTGLATANQGVLTTGATGIPVITALATNGQIIIGSTAGVPAAATITAGTGISIANGANSITISVNGSVVGETITGDSGGALSPTAGNWNIIGGTVAAGTSPLKTAGAGSTLTINAQRSQAIAAADNSKVGLSNFNSAQFTVDANGFVGLKGSTSNPGILGIHPNATSGTGTDPTVADASGNVSILGLSVAAGTNPVRTVATSVNSITTLVQTSQALAAADATKIGLANFDSSTFGVDANGFVTLTAGGGIFTLSDDVGTTVTPTAGNIQLQGHVVNGSGNFSTTVAGSHLIKINPMSTAKWIVDPDGFNGTHTTIASAITSATTDDTILVLPGTYTENFTLSKNITLFAYQAQYREASNVELVGKITISSTGVDLKMYGFKLTTNGSNSLLLSSAGGSFATFENCYFNATNADAISFTSASSSSNIYLKNCSGSLSSSRALFTASTPGYIWIDDCIFIDQSGTLASNSMTTGTINIRDSFVYLPITMTNNTGSLFAENVKWGIVGGSHGSKTWITTATAGTHYIYDCQFVSGSSSCISVGGSTTVYLVNAVLSSSATNVTTGTGTINLGNLVYTSSSSGNNVSTTNLLTKRN